MELWDAYDANFNKIEGITLVRGEEPSFSDDIFHLVCDIIVRHVDGTYLLMQRDLHKHFGGMWEATAGGSALQGETPLVCAKRELEEETGYKTEKIEFLISIKTTVAFCNENIDIYVAKDLQPSKQNLDEDEFINVEVYSVDELCEMIYAGKIEDSKTVSAILAYKNKYL